MILLMQEFECESSECQSDPIIFRQQSERQIHEDAWQIISRLPK